MNNKKIIIFLSIILIIIIVFFIFVISHVAKPKKNDIKDNTKIEEKIEDKKIEEIPEEIPTEEPEEEPKEEEKKEETPKEEEKPKEQPKKEEKKKTNPVTPTKPKEETPKEEPVTPTTPTEPTTPTTPTIEYTCPNGYTLNGTKCTHTVDATLTCPQGQHQSSDGNLSGCIDFNEGHTAENGCPSGEIEIAMISLGGPTTYNCYPVHPKIYVCESGYTLNGTKCSKTIDATIK